jgi:hypothetical protein
MMMAIVIPDRSRRESRPRLSSGAKPREWPAKTLHSAQAVAARMRTQGRILFRFLRSAV